MNVLVTCEHARGDVPDGIDLGLSASTLASHVSMDAGAEEVAVALAEALGAPLHRGSFSRLVVDLNRREENPDVILGTTYGMDVPGNLGLSPQDREERIARFHRPYRDAARADAVQRSARGGCLHLSVHSFDPSLDPEARAFDAGVLFDTARAAEVSVAGRLLRSLGGAGLDVRANDPYAGVPEGLTSWLREQLPKERYVGLEIEVQQTRFSTAWARRRIAGQLAAAASAITGW
ncbi:MAG: N-formylglutamate amidohydrolase [Sandaracinaceae bacterium]